MNAPFFPRDLTEDNDLFGLLLFLIHESGNEELYGNLHGLRCYGLRIKQTESGNYILRPDIDPTGDDGFLPGQYEELRAKYMEPWADEIKKLLQEVKKEIIKKQI